MNNGEMILILGGARAGKSRFALELASERSASPDSQVCFIATAEALDDEMRERIERHRAERPASWRTIEEPRRIDHAIERAREARVVIVDCLTLFVSNMLTANDSSNAEETTNAVIDRFLHFVSAASATVICISNETGLGVVPDNQLGRRFRDLLGAVNQRVAASADRVFLMVAGLPLPIKPQARAGER